MGVIGGSGLVLWFPEFFSRVPARARGSTSRCWCTARRALLAVGFIFTIHFFNSHLRPEKFPMDPVIFTGRVSRARTARRSGPAEYERLAARAAARGARGGPAPAWRAALARRIVGGRRRDARPGHGRADPLRGAVLALTLQRLTRAGRHGRDARSRTHGAESKFRHVRNPITLFGVWLTTVSAMLFLVVFLADLFGLHTNPYIGHRVLPRPARAFFVFGLRADPARHVCARRRGAPGQAGARAAAGRSST